MGRRPAEDSRLTVMPSAINSLIVGQLVRHRVKNLFGDVTTFGFRRVRRVGRKLEVRQSSLWGVSEYFRLV